ncbi:MAG: cob(I)yrinic acid a,c-diamide adenosyltransferase, partial [Saprospiraceae bacterium]|nr:cob(I)yrinic acid a,c-diamide adenosyltransferase [Saprospiraceae bacterium]
MKIYTKTGDRGQTALWGGRRVSKTNPQVEAYGNVDELNSWIGLLLANSTTEKHEQKKTLLDVQRHLFSIGAMLAQDQERSRKNNDFKLEADAVALLEAEIDAMEKDLQPLTSFILPSGGEATSRAHVCRTVCRRAERSVVALEEHLPLDEILV